MSGIISKLISIPTSTAITGGLEVLIPLELKEVIYNASSTFTVPSNAINNEFYVGCTGGGGGSYPTNDSSTGGGGGSGRTSGIFTLTPGQQIPVTVGTGVINNDGGASFFGSYLSCPGGLKGTSHTYGQGTNGGGNGSTQNGSKATSSNCPAMFTLKDGAIDNTSKLYTAKSYSGGGLGVYDWGGGAGCYGVGGGTIPDINTGSGCSGYYNSGKGADGKVVIYYYVLRAVEYTFTTSSTTKTFTLADMFTAEQLASYEYFIINIPNGISIEGPNGVDGNPGTNGGPAFNFLNTDGLTINVINDGSLSGGDAGNGETRVIETNTNFSPLNSFTIDSEVTTYPGSPSEWVTGWNINNVCSYSGDGVVSKGSSGQNGVIRTITWNEMAGGDG